MGGLCFSGIGKEGSVCGPLSRTSGKWQVSTGGGLQPSWRRDAKEIFYIAPDNKLMAAEVKAGGPGFEIGAVRPLFETRPFRSGGWPYDPAADGQRFLVNYAGQQPDAAITLVLNWNAEAKN